MSFPFGQDVSALRQRLLLAIGGGSLIGIAAGCASLSNDPQDGGAISQGGKGSTAGSIAQSGKGGSSEGGSTPAKPVICELGNSPVQMCWSREEMRGKARFGCGQIPRSPEPTEAEIAGAFLDSGCLPKEMACDGCCNPASSDGVPNADGSCCYTYCPGACCGRPFEVAGETRVASAAARTDWLRPAGRVPTAEPTLPAALAARIAREWLIDAGMEHASIASFARFTLDLLSAGAPAQLLEHAQRAALDEVAHARACFELASRYAGVAYGPSALRTGDCRPAASLHDAVVSAFSEGCIGETLAAAHARCALEHARDAQVRDALARIAEDETRHAELAWRFVAWGLHRSGEATRAALQHALDRALAAQPAPPSEHEDPETLAILHAAGRLSASESAELARRTLRDVVVPCTLTLLNLHPSAQDSGPG